MSLYISYICNIHLEQNVDFKTGFLRIFFFTFIEVKQTWPIVREVHSEKKKSCASDFQQVHVDHDSTVMYNPNSNIPCLFKVQGL